MERDKRAGIIGEIFFQKNEESLTTNVAGRVVTLMISKKTPEDSDDGAWWQHTLMIIVTLTK